MIDIDRQQIEHLYYVEKKSAPEIAKIFGCNPWVIYEHMKKNRMHRRSYSEAHRTRYGNHKIDLSEIIYLYFEKKLTLKAIGIRFDVSSEAIRTRLIEAGYTCRKRNKGSRPKFTDVEAAEMARLYHEEERFPAEIADHYNTHLSTILSTLRRVPGFRFRTRKEVWILRRKKETASKVSGATSHTETNGKTGRTRTYTPPKRLGKVFDPIPLLPPEQVTPQRILQLRNEDELTLDDIAAICSMSRVDIYNILQETGGI